MRRRERETVRLTGECVLEEEWMTDICISIWDVKSLDISNQFTFKTEQSMDVYILLYYILK